MGDGCQFGVWSLAFVPRVNLTSWCLGSVIKVGRLPNHGVLVQESRRYAHWIISSVVILKKRWTLTSTVLNLKIKPLQVRIKEARHPDQLETNMVAQPCATKEASRLWDVALQLKDEVTHIIARGVPCFSANHIIWTRGANYLQDLDMLTVCFDWLLQPNA